MAAYATADQVFARLDQLDPDDEALIALITELLEQEAAVIDTEIGHGWGTAAAGTVVVYGSGTDYLPLPPFVAGSVTGVTAPSGYTVPDYVEDADARALVWVSSTGVKRTWPDAVGWAEGVPFTVALDLGWPAAPDDIVKANIELAIRALKGKDAGYSDVIGVEGGGAVGYNGKYPAETARVLANYKRQARPVVAR